jgi:hypothetical protein
MNLTGFAHPCTMPAFAAHCLSSLKVHLRATLHPWALNPSLKFHEWSFFSFAIFSETCTPSPRALQSIRK